MTKSYINCTIWMEYVIIYQIILLIYLEIKNNIINIIKYTTIYVQYYDS